MGAGTAKQGGSSKKRAWFPPIDRQAHDMHAHFFFIPINFSANSDRVKSFPCAALGRLAGKLVGDSGFNSGPNMATSFGLCSHGKILIYIAYFILDQLETILNLWSVILKCKSITYFWSSCPIWEISGLQLYLLRSLAHCSAVIQSSCLQFDHVSSRAHRLRAVSQTEGCILRRSHL